MLTSQVYQKNVIRNASIERRASSLLKNEKKMILQKRPLFVLVATPLGLNGRGGIDRLNDSIFEDIRSRPELNVSVDRLVTRGQRGLFTAQFVFAFALMRLVWAKILGRVDVLHIHLSNWGSSYRKTTLAKIARIFGIPYTVHLHGSGFDEFWSAAPAHLSRAVSEIFNHSQQIIVLGHYWAQAIVSRLPQVADKIVILPNATKAGHQPQLAALDSRVRITCLGQLGERKGTSLLIEALGQLSSRNDWTATIAGDGAIADARKQVQNLGLQDRIQIPGWLSTSQADTLLTKTDVLVLPSYAENLPMVILEAFAHGVPVISTPIGAIPEVVIPDRTGLLVPVGNVKELAEAIERLIQDSVLRDRLGSAARDEHARKYELHEYVSAITLLWQKLRPRLQVRATVGRTN